MTAKPKVLVTGASGLIGHLVISASRRPLCIQRPQPPPGRRYPPHRRRASPISIAVRRGLRRHGHGAAPGRRDAGLRQLGQGGRHHNGRHAQRVPRGTGGRRQARRLRQRRQHHDRLSEWSGLALRASSPPTSSQRMPDGRAYGVAHRPAAAGRFLQRRQAVRRTYWPPVLGQIWHVRAGDPRRCRAAR